MKKNLSALPIEKKIIKAKKVIGQAYNKFPHREIALAWTGGKDSTLVLWLVREIGREESLPLPRILFIDEGDVFKETKNFVEKWSKKWGFKVNFVQNQDVLKQVKKLGDPVYVKKLSKKNQQEVKKLRFKKDYFPFEPESLVGNHLMKTVAMNEWIEKNQIKALITGIRWDEQKARSKETYFSPRKKPNHTRIHPILHFRERDVWETTQKLKIPYLELYQDGYRSLGAKSSTEKAAVVPAWKQDFKKTPERSGRRQDKERVMEKLRKLGYM